MESLALPQRILSDEELFLSSLYNFKMCPFFLSDSLAA
jgi:hypothetical protein